MEIFEKIKDLLKKPEIKLLTSNNADFVLSFLYYEFKINEKDKIAKSDLHYDLKYFISQLPNNEVGYQAAKHYISEWQTADKPFLKTLYFDQEEKEYIIQPTIHVKHIFQWIDNLQKENIISSEIGFLSILETIKNLVFGTLENADEKLAKLKDERDKIETQIEKLEKIKLNDEKIELLDTYLIQDTYKKIVIDAEKLIFDFEFVSEKYFELKENIKDRFNIKKLSKGKILGNYLSEETKLQENRLVKSYNEFRKYLRPEYKEELDKLIQKIHNLPDIHEIEDKFLKNLTINLWQASKNIGKIDDEIFAWLKNIFDKNYQEKVKKTYELIQDIKKEVLLNKDNFPDKINLIEIDSSPDIYTHRYYSEPIKKIKFAKKKIKKHSNELPNEEKDKFINSFFLDIDRLKNNIKNLLNDKDSITLKEVVDNFPIEQGLPEIIAYTMIASESNNDINRIKKQIIIYDNEFEISLPLITYKNELE